MGIQQVIKISFPGKSLLLGGIWMDFPIQGQMNFVSFSLKSILLLVHLLVLWCFLLCYMVQNHWNEMSFCYVGQDVALLTLETPKHMSKNAVLKEISTTVHSIPEKIPLKNW